VKPSRQIHATQQELKARFTWRCLNKSLQNQTGALESSQRFSWLNLSQMSFADPSIAHEQIPLPARVEGFGAGPSRKDRKPPWPLAPPHRLPLDGECPCGSGALEGGSAGPPPTQLSPATRRWPPPATTAQGPQALAAPVAPKPSRPPSSGNTGTNASTASFSGSGDPMAGTCNIWNDVSGFAQLIMANTLTTSCL
jgi:hypothetical protein